MTKKPVCLYLRYSSASQTEQSIEGQMRVCRDYCSRHDMEVVATYIDRAASASHNAEKRVDFQRMITDAGKGIFESVVVYKLDRFARNRYDSATYKAKLKKHGVTLVSATEALSDSPESIILESVLEGMAEFYSAELSQKIKRGQRESASKCQTTGGRVPLGFRFDDNHKYAIDENTAPIVQDAFRRYAEGETIMDICRIFNAQGLRSSTGAKFNRSSFHRMFGNKRYIGYYVNGKEEVPDAIPRIIDDDIWEKVQIRMRNNKKHPGSQKAKDPYILLGKLFCGHCGSPMIGDSGTGQSNGQLYHYYVCQKKKKQRACDKRPVPKQFIEDYVVDRAKELLTDEIIEKLAKAAVEENNRINAENTIIKSLRSRQADVERSLGNLLKVLETGLESETIANRVKELENEKALISKELIRAEKEIIKLDEDMIIFWLSRFRQGDYSDARFRRRLVDLLVNSVTLWDEPDGFRVTLVFNMVDAKGEQTITADKVSDVDSFAPLMKFGTNWIVFVVTKRETF